MASGSMQPPDPADADARVLEIVRDLSPLGAAELGPDTDLIADLGFDSLGLVELLVDLEETLDLPPLDAQVLAQMERVGDLQRLVDESLARIPPG